MNSAKKIILYCKALLKTPKVHDYSPFCLSMDTHFIIIKEIKYTNAPKGYKEGRDKYCNFFHFLKVHDK